MGSIFKYLGGKDSARSLWENKESLDKYLLHLRNLMMGDPNSRMTEDETTKAAKIRAELFNSGLRGKELITTLKERLLVENGFLD